MTLTANAPVDIPTVVDSLSGVELFYRTSIPSGPTNTSVKRLVIVANESYPFILGLILRQQAIPNRIVLRRDRFHVVATVRDWEQFKGVADEVERALGEFQLDSVNTIENVGEPLDSGRLSATLITKLSDTQLQTLETAYNMGYFDVPRRSSATDVADRLDISQSSFSERLRTAERNLLELLFGAAADEHDRPPYKER